MGDSHLEWLNQFAKGLELLDDYDHEKLGAKGLSKQQAMYPDIREYQEVVKAMKKDFESGVFGKEKDGSFKSEPIQGSQQYLLLFPSNFARSGKRSFWFSKKLSLLNLL